MGSGYRGGGWVEVGYRRGCMNGWVIYVSKNSFLAIATVLETTLWDSET